MESVLAELYFDKKGTGYVATSNINTNQLVLKEHTVITICKKSKSYKDIIFKMIHLLTLNKKTLLKFNNLCPHKTDPLCIPECKMKKMIGEINSNGVRFYLSNIPITNAILYYEKIRRNIFECGDKMFLMFDGSKFNHSCDPNVDYYFDEKENILSFYANKDINKGIELTISYIKPNIDKTCLKTTYGFDCDCKICIGSIK